VQNQKRYPAASFKKISVPNQLPFEEGKFDLVFSVYVIEHTTNPAIFLDECIRVLKPGGVLIILCPDYMGTSRMASQRAGFSAGNTSDKLKRRKYLDALVTYYDNNFRIPSYCRKLLSVIAAKSQFTLTSFQRFLLITSLPM
jgi:SAM-dependent methyltransferase